MEYKSSEQEVKDSRVPLYYDGETVSGKVCLVPEVVWDFIEFRGLDMFHIYGLSDIQ